MAEHQPGRVTHGYVLINVDPTRTEAVLERLSSILGARVHEVLGPYDIVVELEAEAPEYLTQIVREKIRHVQGITSTVTCTWME